MPPPSFAALPDAAAPPAVPVMDVIAGLSRALDITEGHPRGHAARSCLVGMAIAAELGLSETERSDLFHALLLKDAGCSSNAARLHQLIGGDDQAAKRARWVTDWRRWPEKIRYGLEYAGRGERPWQRVVRIARVALVGERTERELFQIRCDRGAAIALDIGLSPATAAAIRWMDEHWDGGGQFEGLAGDRIPLLAQIIGLAQVMEIYWEQDGLEAARQVVRARRRRWFSPALADLGLALCDRRHFWRRLGAVDPLTLLHEVAPAPAMVHAEAGRLDRVVEAFAGVIDAKSPYTHDHSRRVGDYAVAAARRLGFTADRLTRLRRAALLHDIGKLGIPDMILLKPGPLTEAEWEIMRRHPQYARDMLWPIAYLRPAVDIPYCHHEKWDGTGYPRGLAGETIPLAARIFAVVDVWDALRSDRPYRPAWAEQRVREYIADLSGTHFDPTVVSAFLAAASVDAG